MRASHLIGLALAAASCAASGGQNQMDGTGGTAGAGAATGGMIGSGGVPTTGGAAGTGAAAGAGGARVAMSTGGAAGSSLLSDSFENGAGQWLTNGGGTATVSADGSHVFDLASSSKVLLAAAGDVAWTDVTVRAKVKIVSWAGSSSSDYAGICARVADADDYTCVILRGDSKLAIREDDGGSGSTLGSTVSASLTTGTWYTVTLRIDGQGVVASLDGAMVLPKAGDAAPLAASPTGGIALIAANAEAEFDDVTVDR